MFLFLASAGSSLARTGSANQFPKPKLFDLQRNVTANRDGLFFALKQSDQLFFDLRLQRSATASRLKKMREALAECAVPCPLVSDVINALVERREVGENRIEGSLATGFGLEKELKLEQAMCDWELGKKDDLPEGLACMSRKENWKVCLEGEASQYFPTVLRLAELLCACQCPALFGAPWANLEEGCPVMSKAFECTTAPRGGAFAAPPEECSVFRKLTDSDDQLILGLVECKNHAEGCAEQPGVEGSPYVACGQTMKAKGGEGCKQELKTTGKVSDPALCCGLLKEMTICTGGEKCFSIGTGAILWTAEPSEANTLKAYVDACPDEGMATFQGISKIMNETLKPYSLIEKERGRMTTLTTTTSSLPFPKSQLVKNHERFECVQVSQDQTHCSVWELSSKFLWPETETQKETVWFLGRRSCNIYELFPDAFHFATYVCNATRMPDTGMTSTSQSTCQASQGDSEDSRWAAPNADGNAECFCDNRCYLKENACHDTAETTCGSREVFGQHNEACKEEMQVQCCPAHKGRICRKRITNDVTTDAETSEIFKTTMNCKVTRYSANALYADEELCEGKQFHYDAEGSEIARYQVESTKVCTVPPGGFGYCRNHSYDFRKVGPMDETSGELKGQLEWRKRSFGVCEAFSRDRGVCTRRVWEGTYVFDTREGFLRPTEPPKKLVIVDDAAGVSSFVILIVIFGGAVLSFVGLYVYVRKKAEREEMEKKMAEVQDNWGGRRDSDVSIGG